MSERPLEIRGMTAATEAGPADETELSEILTRAHSEGTACCIAGGATKWGWGNRPERFDLLLSTAGLRGPVDVDADNLTLSAAAGITVDEARSMAQEVDRILPLDPGCPSRASIGGVAATGDQGARAAGYGGLRDVVLGVRATLADGSTVRFGGRTMKNVTGYDMTKLFIGSFGVLGVITEVTFRLLPHPDTQALLVLPLPSLQDTKATAARILSSYLQPLALEVVSPTELPAQIADVSGGNAGAENATEADSPILLAGFAGHQAAVARSIREVTEARPGAASRVLRDDAAEAMYEHLAGLRVPDADGAPLGPVRNAIGTLSVRASVPISRALDMVEMAQRYCRENDFSLGYRAGAARGRVDLIFHNEAVGADATQRRFADCVTAMRVEAARMQGWLIVTGGSALLPPDFDAWGDVGPSLAVMKRIKERLDPKRILNPGRFVGGI